MAALWLYGQPETLAPQQGQWVDRYRGFQERDRAAAMTAAQINARLAQEQQRADESAMQRDFANRINLSRYGPEQVESNRRFDLEFGLKNSAVAENAAIRREAIAARPDIHQARTQQYEDQRLQQMADAGEFDDDAHVRTLAPAIPGPLAKLYAARSKGVRNEIESERAEVKAAADTLTKYSQALKAREQLSKPGFFGSGKQEYQSKVKEFDDIIKQLSPRANALLNPKNPISNLLLPDPTTGTYTALLPDLPWEKRLRNLSRTTSNDFTPVMGDARMSERGANLSRFATGVATDLVPVLNPAGQPVKIRRSQLADALNKGYRVR